jgi:hypothetical protein
LVREGGNFVITNYSDPAGMESRIGRLNSTILNDEPGPIAAIVILSVHHARSDTPVTTEVGVIERSEISGVQVPAGLTDFLEARDIRIIHPGSYASIFYQDVPHLNLLQKAGITETRYHALHLNDGRTSQETVLVMLDRLREERNGISAQAHTIASQIINKSTPDILQKTIEAQRLEFSDVGVLPSNPPGRNLNTPEL